MISQVVTIDHSPDGISLVPDSFVKVGFNAIDLTTLKFRAVHSLEWPRVDVVNSEALGIKRNEGTVNQIFLGECNALRVFGPV
jgi:hypothetical protein